MEAVATYLLYIKSNGFGVFAEYVLGHGIVCYVAPTIYTLVVHF